LRASRPPATKSNCAVTATALPAAVPRCCTAAQRNCGPRQRAAAAASPHTNSRGCLAMRLKRRAYPPGALPICFSRMSSCAMAAFAQLESRPTRGAP